MSERRTTFQFSFGKKDASRRDQTVEGARACGARARESALHGKVQIY
jgi:hypothetical protein